MQTELISPGAALREAMEARGWTQRDVAMVLGKTLQTVNELLLSKRSLTPEMAVAISQAFGETPEYWLSLEAAYRVAMVTSVTGDIAKRARDLDRRNYLVELAPIKDMVKRGWISHTEGVDNLERELLAFFDVPSLDSEPSISASARKSDGNAIFNSAQRAWTFRAKKIAKAVNVSAFSESKLRAGIKKMRSLLGWPSEARKVPSILAECGIRYVVVEPLPHTRIDGVAFWLDDGSPVIAMSTRFDRIDNFWHVLGHEISHIRHRDIPAVDSDSAPGESPVGTNDEIESRANRESAETWIDATEMKSFVRRVGPLYSIDKINQFANRMRVHPGIIIGQLQGCGELRFQAFRDSLVEIRDYVVAEALTDGWGHVVGL